MWGSPGWRQGYSWIVQRGWSTSVCVQVWGFSATYPKGHWYGGGCGKSAITSAPWGNVLAVPRLRAKSFSLTGGFVIWHH